MQRALTAVPGRTALVFDSPHSGTDYPQDFRPACDLQVLRRAEDTHVDRLFEFVPGLGAAWVHAHFPRSYLDANRACDEIDPALLDAPWPGPVASTDKVALGKGLVWRLTDDGVPLYDRKLTVGEVQGRIERCWQPYHDAVEQAVQAAAGRHGLVLHINCHSMPSVAGSHATLQPGLVHPDFVVGDRDGTSADPALGRWLVGQLQQAGYSAALNQPYKGVELVRRHGHPARGRHSVQLEINRRLYMDEHSLELHAGFDRLQSLLVRLAQQLLVLGSSATSFLRPVAASDPGG